MRFVRWVFEDELQPSDKVIKGLRSTADGEVIVGCEPLEATE